MGEPAGICSPFLLSLVLVLQVLPGHFQLAFQTQVTLGLMVLWAIARAMGGRPAAASREPAVAVEGAGPALRRAVAVMVAVASVFPLAAIQLWPTARLAGMAGGQRDFEYLSGFAETPLHLVNLVAPGLFHREAAGGRSVWDPFHTSPEECLAYIGLVPLFLAVLAMAKEFRRDAAVRLLTILALATLFLSLGPYVPGFRVLIELPGLLVLPGPVAMEPGDVAGAGDPGGEGVRPLARVAPAGRWMRWLVVVAALWIGGVLGLFELAVRSTADAGWPRVAGWFDRGFKALPWYGDPGLSRPDPSFREVMAQARKPASDPHVPPELHPAIVLQKTVNPRSLVGQRRTIYLVELGETILWLVLIGIAAGSDRPGDRRTRAAPSLLLLLTFLDLWTLGRHRLIDTEPIRPLAEQSPVLARLAQERRGTRIASNLGNLPILVGTAPISAYRTMNLPALESLTQLAQQPMIGTHEPTVRAALRATGTRLRIFHPMESRIARLRARTELPGEPIDDPALARLALRRVVGLRAGGLGEPVPRLACRRAAGEGVVPPLDRRRGGIHPGRVEGRPRRPAAAVRSGRAAAGRIVAARGADGPGRGRQTGLGDRLAARRSAVVGALARPGRPGRIPGEDPARLPQAGRHRGRLAGRRGPLHRPMDAPPDL